MEVPLIPFFRLALSRAAATLVAASLVASCATSTDTPQADSGKTAAAAAPDVNIERVVLQAYRAIGDRHLYEPNFRTLSAETYRGFASADPSLSLATSDGAFTVKRDGRDVSDPARAGRSVRRPGLGRHAGRAVRRLRWTPRLSCSRPTVRS